MSKWISVLTGKWKCCLPGKGAASIFKRIVNLLLNSAYFLFICILIKCKFWLRMLALNHSYFLLLRFVNVSQQTTSAPFLARIFLVDHFGSKVDKARSRLLCSRHSSPLLPFFSRCLHGKQIVLCLTSLLHEMLSRL